MPAGRAGGRLGRLWLAPLLVLLAGCDRGGNGELPGDMTDPRAFTGIGVDEELRFAGTEPFWGGQVTGERMVFRTPDNGDGETIAVSRFAGRGGLSFSGAMTQGPFTMAVTPAPCSDGMSDREYPFTVTIALKGSQLEGCGWTARQPYTGEPNP